MDIANGLQSIVLIDYDRMMSANKARVINLLSTRNECQ